jgi:hypothetical protein
VAKTSDAQSGHIGRDERKEEGEPNSLRSDKAHRMIGAFIPRAGQQASDIGKRWNAQCSSRGAQELDKQMEK